MQRSISIYKKRQSRARFLRAVQGTRESGAHSRTVSVLNRQRRSQCRTTYSVRYIIQASPQSVPKHSGEGVFAPGSPLLADGPTTNPYRQPGQTRHFIRSANFLNQETARAVQLTLVRLMSFHKIIGTMKMGMPMYDATKSDEDQLPFKKTGNPATKVMMVEPINPTQAA